MKARFKIHANKNATLSGIPYDIIKGIITEAAIQNYERIEKAEKENNQNAKDYHNKLKQAIDQISDAIDEGIMETHKWYTESKTQKPTKAERFAKVRKDIRFRKIMNEMVGE